MSTENVPVCSDAKPRLSTSQNRSLCTSGQPTTVCGNMDAKFPFLEGHAPSFRSPLRPQRALVRREQAPNNPKPTFLIRQVPVTAGSLVSEISAARTKSPAAPAGTSARAYEVSKSNKTPVGYYCQSLYGPRVIFMSV